MSESTRQAAPEAAPDEVTAHPVRAAADADLRAGGQDGLPAVERLEVSAYTVPTEGPEADGTLAWNAVRLVAVEAHSGECTGLGWTYAPAVAGAVVRDLLAGQVVGACALDVAGAHQAMCRAVRDAGRAGLVGHALSAVDIALWDLKARLLRLPLLHLIGAVREEVPVYGSGGFTTYHDTQLAGQVGGWVHGQGIGRVKIEIGESWGRNPHRDLRRVRHAREAIGPNADLYVAAGGAYSRKQAIRVGRAMAVEAVGLFEEPVPSEDVDGLREVRDALDCDVTAGAHGHDLASFARLADAQAVDCLQIDATRCGGVTEWLRAAALAQGHGLEVSALRSPHAHAHLGACTPNLRHLEWFHDHVRVEALLFDGTLDPHGGVLRPSSGGGPGHGMRLRHSDAQRYRVA